MLLAQTATKEFLLPEEDDYGNTEYKIKLDTSILTMDRVKHLTTQMTFRLNEGEGTAFY
jgi:GTPase